MTYHKQKMHNNTDMNTYELFTLNRDFFLQDHHHQSISCLFKFIKDRTFQLIFLVADSICQLAIGSIGAKTYDRQCIYGTIPRHNNFLNRKKKKKTKRIEKDLQAIFHSNANIHFQQNPFFFIYISRSSRSLHSCQMCVSSERLSLFKS